jgi:hypothetical protein
MSWMSRVMSSITKMKTSSMASRPCLVTRVTSQARWHSVGTRASKSGTASVTATTVHSPSSRSSSSRGSGRVPLTRASAGRLKRTRQRFRPGSEGARRRPAGRRPRPRGAGRPAGCRRSPPEAGRPSARARMWSWQARTAPTSSGVAATSPLRTRSKAVSQWWVKAARASKPNMAPDPFRVWRPRNTASTRSRSPGRWARSSRPCSISSSRSWASWRNVSMGSRPLTWPGPS